MFGNKYILNRKFRKRKIQNDPDNSLEPRRKMIKVSDAPEEQSFRAYKYLLNRRSLKRKIQDNSDNSLEPHRKRIKVSDAPEDESFRACNGLEEDENEKETSEGSSNNVTEETESNNLQTLVEIVTSESGDATSIDVNENKSNDIEFAFSTPEACSENYVSDKGDVKSENCLICLKKLETQEVETAQACKHYFCLSCLQELAKKSNVCPVDRQMFAEILVRRCLEGEVTGRITLEQPRQQEDDDVRNVVDNQPTCDVCGELDFLDPMLTCLECNYSCHLECLDTEPDEEPACPNCHQTALFNELVEYRCSICRHRDRQDSILICGGCYRAYHLECLGLLSDNLLVEEGSCPNCNQSRLFNPQELRKCSTCRRLDLQVSMLICVDCFCSFHLQCLDPPTDAVIVEERSCPNCFEKRLFNPLEGLRCGTCRQLSRPGGMLVCDGCDRYYHLQCLEPSTGRVPDRKRSCPNCNQTELINPVFAHKCSLCGKRNRQNNMISCVVCNHYYHRGCCYPSESNVSLEVWPCPNCIQYGLTDLSIRDFDCWICLESSRRDLMFFCAECIAYFHQECLETTKDGIPPLEGTICPDCNRVPLIKPNIQELAQ